MWLMCDARMSPSLARTLAHGKCAFCLPLRVKENPTLVPCSHMHRHQVSLCWRLSALDTWAKTTPVSQNYVRVICGLDIMPQFRANGGLKHVDISSCSGSATQISVAGILVWVLCPKEGGRCATSNQSSNCISGQEALLHHLVLVDFCRSRLPQIYGVTLVRLGQRLKPVSGSTSSRPCLAMLAMCNPQGSMHARSKL